MFLTVLLSIKVNAAKTSTITLKVVRVVLKGNLGLMIKKIMYNNLYTNCKPLVKKLF